MASSHIESCASLFTRGHTLGSLYQKDPITNDLIKDNNGEYILTDPPVPIVPDEGIILSSGSPLHMNTQDKDDQTTRHGEGGDWDLKKTVDDSNGKNNAIHDACVLQFDFRCLGGEGYIPHIEFKYIFGSEEYYEYVTSVFNDVFGFYLNGENIAKLPTTDTNSSVVSINNVNYAKNKKYFHGNDPGTGWQTEMDPNAPDTEVVYPTIEMDGFTDTLTALGTPDDNVNEWNTIKLAVGDVGDNILDSWVVLQSASFTCVDVTNSPSVSLSPSLGKFVLCSFLYEMMMYLIVCHAMALTFLLLLSKTYTAHSNQPSVSAAPSTSTSPSTSSEPTVSSNPTTSSAPSISTAPTESSKPTMSSGPSVTVTLSPTISAAPTLSSLPSTSSKPTISSEPSVSTAPTESSSPTLSSKPTTSSNPTLSLMPTASSKPTASSAPTISSKPTISSRPTVSTAPTESTNPTLSSKPTMSSGPSVTVTLSPTISAAPTLSSLPSTSSKPTISSEPSVSTAPTESTNPTLSSKPTMSASPTASEVPTMSTEPTISTKPTVSNAPSTSSQPSMSTGPTESTKPTVSATRKFMLDT